MAFTKIVLSFLVIAMMGCAQFGQVKKNVPEASNQTLQRTPAEEGVATEQAQLKAELLRLQEENAKLRAQLIELQQKIALMPAPKKKEKEKSKEPAVAKVKEPVSNRKPSKVQKVASSKKQKKPKVIQISFEEEKTDSTKN